jgi:hypothetical protein
VVFSRRDRSTQSAKCRAASWTLMVLSFTFQAYLRLADWQARARSSTVVFRQTAGNKTIAIGSYRHRGALAREKALVVGSRVYSPHRLEGLLNSRQIKLQTCQDE